MSTSDLSHVPTHNSVSLPQSNDCDDNPTDILENVLSAEQTNTAISNIDYDESLPC